MLTTNAILQTPFLLEPLLVERVWGASSIGSWYAAPKLGKLIGEVWLTANECNARGYGPTLGELARLFPDELGAENGAEFPLLVKVLFPNEKLSVQVHPDDTYARSRLKEPRGKTECWYVLSAESGAQVAVGLRKSLSKPEMHSAIVDGTIESELNMVDVKAGDMIFVPAGTVHALGPGIVVLETQQYSDVTFRLWDYGRPRALHVQRGLEVINEGSLAGVVKPLRRNGYECLINTPFFTVDRVSLPRGGKQVLDVPQRMQIFVALSDGCTLQATDSRQSSTLQPGFALVVPATQDYMVLTAQGAAEVLRISAGLQQQPA